MGESSALGNLVDRIIRRRRLYWLRSSQSAIVCCAAVLGLGAGYSTGPGFVRVLLLSLIVGLALYWIVKLERRWLAEHRMPIFGPGGLPKHDGTAGKSELRGAHWRSLWDLWLRCRWRPGAIRLGRLAPEQRLFGFFFGATLGFVPSRHVLIVAPTRAGKGTMGIVPNLLTLPNPVLVVDPKGELARITAARRGGGKKQFAGSRVTNSMGQAVHVFDPYGTTRGRHNASFNPLAEIDPTAPDAVTLVGTLVRSICPEDSGGSEGDKSFREQARSLIEAVILHVLTVEEPEHRHLVRVWQLLTQGDVEFLEMLRYSAAAECVELDVASPMEALYVALAHNEAFGGVIASVGRFMLELVPETRDGIVFTARPELDFLKDPQIQACLRTSSFSLADLFRTGTSIYLCLPVTKIVGQQRRVLLMFINLLLDVMERTEGREHPYVFIDELASLGYIQSIERAMGLVKHRLTLVPIFQDVSQIRRLYKESWQNFAANCSIIALRVGNLETAQWLSERIGHVYKESRGTAGEPLIAAHELQGAFSHDKDRRVIFDDGIPALLEGMPYMQTFPSSMYDEP